ncbi:ethylene-responsive transcription factor 10-like [Sesamum indicum]|uniref:Ethylene-responsive transcription factor 10-like n=1 Tax=Sesamum indicum TaxID=4182 RepID=A0A6I9T3U0_SESIN|nr:ethylene-responsive transcription factor 10-like [Sesamum indicum]
MESKKSQWASERREFIGVSRRKSGKYAARITHPLMKKRLWLGSFSTPEEAYKAYLSKKKSSVQDSSSSDLSSETDHANAVKEESFGENNIPQLNQEVKFGVLNGVQIVDRNGFLIGEFSKLDDLSICASKDGALLGCPDVGVSKLYELDQTLINVWDLGPTLCI